MWLHEIWWNWGNDEEWLWWTHTDLDLDPNYLSHFYVVLAVINHRLKWLRQVVLDVVGSIQYLFVTYVHNYRSNNLIFMHFTTEMRLLLLVIRILCFVSDFFCPSVCSTCFDCKTKKKIDGSCSKFAVLTVSLMSSCNFRSSNSSRHD